MISFNIDDHKYKKIHFIGIGGISMSGLAEILHSRGYEVTGSDAKESDTTEHLKETGITVYGKHSPEWVKDADLVIYTDAISLDNEELKAAIHLKKDIMDRATFLGQLMKNYKVSIAVSGTHGKTTTTSMISSAIKDLASDPTILLGGKLDDIHGNVRVGKNNLLLTEACEYKANILKFYPTTAIILNMDEDHLDYFDNMDHIRRTFEGYVKNIKKDGTVILNIDDPNVKSLREIAECRVLTFSLEGPADYEARNINYGDNGIPCYDLYYRGKFVSHVCLKVMGRHNVYNSLAAIAACHSNGMMFSHAIRRVRQYTGVHRRLEKKGVKNGVIVFDDYAHHPTEIRSTLHALRQGVRGRLVCVFQPHTFTRTKLLLDSFSSSFHEADSVIITDIYAAREKDYGDIHSKTLVEAVNKKGDLAEYISGFEEIVDHLEEILKPGDVLVTMGAGDVYKIGEMFLRKSE